MRGFVINTERYLTSWVRAVVRMPSGLYGLSEDQCEALSKDQDKLNAWLASVQ